MTVWHAIYQLLIGPLELFFEVVFSLANRVIRHPGLCIVFLSLAMNFLVLPLYRRADAMQAEERDQALRMKPWVDHIKKTFKGDERFMMLQTYYRQVGYKQTDALKGSVSLLLEIPFFIAAYQFLSHLQLLQGVSFGPIADLGAPDGLLKIAGYSINVLPILMTLINVAAAAIYMKGFPLKNKIQMYGMALIFLVLLYTSPSGLVFYWTLNNVFSLFKNVFYKLKNPKRVLCILASAAGLIGLGYVLFVHPMSTTRRQLMLVCALLLLQLPLLILVGKGIVERRREKSGRPEKEVVPLTKAESRGFLYCCIFLALLTGVLIPSAIIHASPEEFINLQAYKSPLWYILSSALTATGLFVIWFGIFYRLAGTKGKRVMNLAAWVVAVCSAVNYLFFGKGHGSLSDVLQYDDYRAASHTEMLINVAVLLVLAAVLYLIWRKKISLTRLASLALCVAAFGLSVFNIADTGSILTQTEEQIQVESYFPQIRLNKNGKNVIVFMLDRAVSGCLPFLLYEKPELKEAFEGFTFYSNTLSYGGATMTGAPPLFGGSEYRPLQLNSRKTETLVEKHNEALKVMPLVFLENGYEVTVCDPSLAGYRWRPDLSIYDEYPDIHTYITAGKLTHEEFENAEALNAFRERNLFCYGIHRIAPVVLQSTLYNRGFYNAVKTTTERGGGIKTPQERDGFSKAEGITESFMKYYSVLCNLPFITKTSDEEKNTFLMITNDTTHNGIMLKEPEYEPAAVIDNTAYDQEHHDRAAEDGRTFYFWSDDQLIHYHSMMASLIQLGKWMDYLRENDVYDNTRIIIVSDHGHELHLDRKALFGSEFFWEDVLRFSSLLLVKDFDSNGAFKTDDRFMTSADTPVLAFQDLIDEPKNPFSGKTIDETYKSEPIQYVLQTEIINFVDYKDAKEVPGRWISVSGDDIYNTTNWQLLGDLPAAE